MLDTDPNGNTMDSIFDSIEDEDVEDHDYDDIKHQLLVLLLVTLLWSVRSGDYSEDGEVVSPTPQFDDACCKAAP
jgi:hypothetical protein